MTIRPETEGKVAFDVPNAGKSCETWYKVIGDISTDAIPVIMLHGGPGAPHGYLTPFTDLYTKYGIPVVFYDQIGCGNSTRLPEKKGDEAFWSVDLFCAELDNLVDHLALRNGFSLLGQSWGGMLAGVYATRRPKALSKIILASGPASGPLVVEGERALIEHLPKDVRDTIYDCERREDFESEKYKEACMVFYKRHVCRIWPFPEDLAKAFEQLEEDSTVYSTMMGPSELSVTGSLKDFDASADAHNIEVPTFIINGRYDEVQDISVLPWFENIPKVKWVQLSNSSHMGHFEERKRYMQLVGSFLGSKKAHFELGHPGEDFM